MYVNPTVLSVDAAELRCTAVTNYFEVLCSVIMALAIIHYGTLVFNASVKGLGPLQGKQKHTINPPRNHMEPICNPSGTHLEHTLDTPGTHV